MTPPRSQAVVVRVLPDITPSAHVVHLRNTERQELWQGVSVYSEKAFSRPRREVVDLGRMVEQGRTKESRRSAAPRTVPTKHARVWTMNVSWLMMVPWRRVAAVGLALVFLVGAPFPAIGYVQALKQTNARVVEESTAAFLALQSSTVAALSSNIGTAQADLNHALESFGNARGLVEKDHGLLLYMSRLIPVVGTQVSSRQALLEAGQHLALGNTYLVKGVNDAEQATTMSLTDRFGIIRNHVRSALPQYNAALQAMNEVDPKAIPVEYQKTFADFKILFGTFINDMEDLVHLVDALTIVFGDQSLKRYLIVFQNNHELRPTGGFMGSFALLDVEKGKIVRIDVPGGGTYDLQGQLSAFVKPPLPLQLVNGRWEFQDANWFPDFSASAKKIQWFYQHGRGRTVDGVIAVNASVLERLLRVVGPIENERFGLLLHHDDALEKIQEQVEVNYDKTENKPKAVLAELLDQFMGQLREAKAVDTVRLLTELHAALEEKEIQIAMNDETAARTFREFGWTGEILPIPPHHDYISVIQTNIAGQKSDARMSQTIEHEAVVGEDGSVIDTVSVRRTHTGTSEEALYGAPNISYLRVYVPPGAELIDVGGFSYPPEDTFHVPEPWYADDADLARLEQDEQIHIDTGTRVTQEFGKTVFGNWVVTSPGETSEVYFRYRLPFLVLPQTTNAPSSGVRRWLSAAPLTSRYRLLIQKQSGVNSDLSMRVIYPTGWLPMWRSDEAIGLAANGAEYEGTLETDKMVSILMQRDPAARSRE